MYSISDLLQLMNSDAADELRLHVGTPPVIVLEGEHHPMDGPALVAEDVVQMLQAIANSRQRREFWEHGKVQFVYRFRQATDFVVCAWQKGDFVGIEIH
jgi:Tfp pilus assembly ATPase PilU